LAETQDIRRQGGKPEDAAQMVPAPEVELWFVREVLPLEASLMQFLRSSYRNSSEAADLRQDIYAQLIAAAQKQIPDPTKPFVFAVAHNILVDRMRRDRVIAMDVISDMEKLGLASDAPPSDRIVIARDELRRLREAIDQLPPRSREAVTMARIEGLSGREIAARLNLDETTVSRHLKKGIQQLVDILYGSAPDMRKIP
jgi:RNA polymerase sigma-70 factor (ECF subfamily)